MLLTTSTLGLNVKCTNSGTLTQVLDSNASADIQRVLASAGLPLEAMWFDSSTLGCSKISLTRIAIKIGCVVREISHCKTVVQLVHMKTHSKFLLELGGMQRHWRTLANYRQKYVVPGVRSSPKSSSLVSWFWQALFVLHSIGTNFLLCLLMFLHPNAAHRHARLPLVPIEHLRFVVPLDQWVQVP